MIRFHGSVVQWFRGSEFRVRDSDSTDSVSRKTLLMAVQSAIEEWRRKIDEVDRELTRLLGRRAEYAIEIGRVKLEEDLQVYDPNREEEVIQNVQSSAGGFLTPEAARRIFERIIDETRRLEREHRKALESAGATPKESNQ